MTFYLPTDAKMNWKTKCGMNFHVLDTSVEVSNQMHSGLLSHISPTLSDHSQSLTHIFKLSTVTTVKQSYFFLVREEENKLLFLFVNISQELMYSANSG